MSDFLIPLPRLVHENLSIIMTYAYSLKPLTEMMSKEFLGEWVYLEKTLYALSAERAEKACVELALFLRMVDDEENLTLYLRNAPNVRDCGRLFLESGVEEPLTFREAANKILHARKLEWKMIILEHGNALKVADAPVLQCHPRDHPSHISPERRWRMAEIDLLKLARFCATIAH